MIESNIWLIGTGYMAIEYAKVLNALKCKYVVIGRGEENCNKFFAETKVAPKLGGLENFIKTNPALPNAVINAVGIEALTESTQQLINYGVKNILLEKPGIGFVDEIQPLSDLAQQNYATIVLAYNRRFYASTLKAQELIEADGGPRTVRFEFTEWSHVIGKLVKTKAEHQNWFLGNSTHIIDTVFHICGFPKELSAYFSGSLDWHPASSRYTGAGITDKNVLFSYHANWEGPGRWEFEIITDKHRYLFKPIEKLQIQKIGSVQFEQVELNDVLDTKYKPGLFLQTKAYLENDYSNFCTIEQQKNNIEKFYNKMSGYKN